MISTTIVFIILFITTKIYSLTTIRARIQNPKRYIYNKHSVSFPIYSNLPTTKQISFVSMRCGSIQSTCPQTPLGISLPVWKILLQIVFTILNISYWYFPLHYQFNNSIVQSYMNSFASGVFLSLVFGNLLPESLDGFKELGYKNLGYWVVLGGYVVVFGIGKVCLSHSHISDYVQLDAKMNITKNQKNKTKHNKKKKVENNKKKNVLILLAALGIHSILEMTAVGISETFSEMVLLSLSMALHQPAESISLLAAFLKSGMTRKRIKKCLIVFSTMGPIGMMLGMMIHQFSIPLLNSVLHALVAGTFLYVSATEIIPEEWDHGERKWKKFGAFLSGIGMVLGILKYSKKLERNYI